MRVILKIFVFLFINSFIFSGALFSQYKIGIQGGVGRSNYVGKDFSKDNNPKYGYTAGVFFEREINLTICLGAEFNYEEKGTFYNFYPREGTAISVDSYFEYLSVPVFIKAYFGKKANYYLFLGADASYLNEFKSITKATEYGYEIDYKPYFPYTYKQWDASLIGGVGFNFYRFVLDFRYHHGLVNIYEGYNSPVIRNSYISTTLGFILYKKKLINCFNDRAY